MSFDGLGDDFRALGVELVAREVEGRQCPHGGDGVCNSNGALWFCSRRRCEGIAVAARLQKMLFPCDLRVFPTLWQCKPTNLVVADIQRRQRPNGGMDGAGISEMYIRLAWRNLLALRKEGGHNNRTRSTQLFAAEVGFGHDGLHGDSLLVPEGDSL